MSQFFVLGVDVRALFIDVLGGEIASSDERMMVRAILYGMHSENAIQLEECIISIISPNLINLINLINLRVMRY